MPIPLSAIAAERFARDSEATCAALGGAIPGIEHDGWFLCGVADGVSRLARITWFAVRGNIAQPVQLCPRHFVPTPARFAWLVENGFPAGIVRPGSTRTPIGNDDIDAALNRRAAA